MKTKRSCCLRAPLRTRATSRISPPHGAGLSASAPRSANAKTTPPHEKSLSRLFEPSRPAPEEPPPPPRPPRSIRSLSSPPAHHLLHHSLSHRAHHVVPRLHTAHAAAARAHRHRLTLVFWRRRRCASAHPAQGRRARLRGARRCGSSASRALQRHLVRADTGACEPRSRTHSHGQ